MLLQTDINEFSFFDTCFEFRQRLRQITQCLLWAQRWLPNNWLPHNLSKKKTANESALFLWYL